MTKHPVIHFYQVMFSNYNALTLENEWLYFVEWCPTGFKVGLNENICAATKNDEMATFKRNCTMIGNNACVTSIINRMCRSFDLMYSQRAYVHWFVGEGMESGEYAEVKSTWHHSHVQK